VVPSAVSRDHPRLAEVVSVAVTGLRELLTRLGGLYDRDVLAPSSGDRAFLIVGNETADAGDLVLGPADSEVDLTSLHVPQFHVASKGTSDTRVRL
jgi:hypothetical protein